MYNLPMIVQNDNPLEYIKQTEDYVVALMFAAILHTLDLNDYMGFDNKWQHYAE